MLELEHAPVPNSPFVTWYVASLEVKAGSFIHYLKLFSPFIFIIAINFFGYVWLFILFKIIFFMICIITK
jgi:hypothetical protein